MDKKKKGHEVSRFSSKLFAGAWLPKRGKLTHFINAVKLYLLKHEFRYIFYEK